MRRLPKFPRVPGYNPGAVGAAARLRPADGAHGHQRDGGARRQVPAPLHPAVRREAGERPAQGALAQHPDQRAVSTLVNSHQLTYRLDQGPGLLRLKRNSSSDSYQKMFW